MAAVVVASSRSWRVARSLLFQLDPERAHRLAVALVARLGHHRAGRALLRALVPQAVDDPVTVMGIRFPNRVGLAAGWDKDALALAGLLEVGFGHVEIGTITPRPQAGNAKPRVFRLPADQALVNRMGFPGLGMDAAAAALAGRSAGQPGVVGVNLGRNKATDNTDAAADYLAVLERLAPWAGYIAINVSSPNTPGLRGLQQRDELEALVAAVAARRDVLVATLGRPLPIAVKIAPDLDEAGLDAVVEAALRGGADGIIATNTTLARDGLHDARQAEQGGLSGRPLERRAREVVAGVARRVDGKLAVIAVGGVHCADDARVRRDLGADLVQLYTGLIFRGPGLIAEVAEALARG